MAPSVLFQYYHPGTSYRYINCRAENWREMLFFSDWFCFLNVPGHDGSCCLSIFGTDNLKHQPCPQACDRNGIWRRHQYIPYDFRFENIIQMICLLWWPVQKINFFCRNLALGLRLWQFHGPHCRWSSREYNWIPAHHHYLFCALRHYDRPRHNRSKNQCNQPEDCLCLWATLMREKKLGEKLHYRRDILLFC